MGTTVCSAEAGNIKYKTQLELVLIWYKVKLCAAVV